MFRRTGTAHSEEAYMFHQMGMCCHLASDMTHWDNSHLGTSPKAWDSFHSGTCHLASFRTDSHQRDTCRWGTSHSDTYRLASYRRDTFRSGTYRLASCHLGTCHLSNTAWCHSLRYRKQNPVTKHNLCGIAISSVHNLSSLAWCHWGTCHSDTCHSASCLMGAYHWDTSHLGTWGRQAFQYRPCYRTADSYQWCSTCSTPVSHIRSRSCHHPLPDMAYHPACPSQNLATGLRHSR